MARSAVVHRCSWAEGDPLMQQYHDTEWGVPERDGRALWEALVLDGFQAGLSWITILRKREAFRKEFRGFDPKIVAEFGEKDIARALANPGIVRSRAKIEGTIACARAYLKMQAEGEDFSSFAWSFVGNAPAKIRGDVPAKTPLSEDDLDRAEEARIQIRRPDHRLRVDAGERPGQRSRRGVLPAKRGVARAGR